MKDLRNNLIYLHSCFISLMTKICSYLCFLRVLLTKTIESTWASL